MNSWGGKNAEVTSCWVCNGPPKFNQNKGIAAKQSRISLGQQCSDHCQMSWVEVSSAHNNFDLIIMIQRWWWIGLTNTHVRLILRHNIVIVFRCKNYNVVIFFQTTLVKGQHVESGSMTMGQESRIGFSKPAAVKRPKGCTVVNDVYLLRPAKKYMPLIVRIPSLHSKGCLVFKSWTIQCSMIPVGERVDWLGQSLVLDRSRGSLRSKWPESDTMFSNDRLITALKTCFHWHHGIGGGVRSIDSIEPFDDQHLAFKTNLNNPMKSNKLINDLHINLTILSYNATWD